MPVRHDALLSLALIISAPLSTASAAPPAPGARPAGPVPAADEEPTPVSSPHPASVTPLKYKVETVVEGLEVPWSIVFAPDGRMFVTERPGRVRLVEHGTLTPEPMLTLRDVANDGGGEIGLMGMCLHPDFAANHFLYLAFGHTDGDVRVVRYLEKAGTLTEDRLILKGLPAASNHAGCCIKFGPDGKLYITAGDATSRKIAQKMDSLGGKTLRLNDDGSIPEDNPFVKPPSGAVRARPEIYSFGHRNAQGMDWQPGTGLLFMTEHGPSGFDGPGGGDELNAVEAGKNYGWPLVHHKATKTGTVAPLVEWTPAVAPGGGAFYTGDAFPELKGNYLVAALGGLQFKPTPGIIRVVLDGRRYAGQERLAAEYGRVRAVAQGPDGAVYFSTSNRDGRAKRRPGDDKIMRLVPEAP